MSTMTYSRASRLASICHKEFDFQFFVYQEEGEYKAWMGLKRILRWIHDLPNSEYWNCVICVMVLTALTMVGGDPGFNGVLDKEIYRLPNLFDYAFNIIYGLHALGILYTGCREGAHTLYDKFCFVLDVLSYSHYVAAVYVDDMCLPADRFLSFKTPHLFMVIKSTCYFVRLHRPLKFICNLQKRNLMGSVLANTVMYVYVFWLLRVTFAVFWKHLYYYQVSEGILTRDQFRQVRNKKNLFDGNEFLYAIYHVGKIFYPIGQDSMPRNDYERVANMIIAVVGTIVYFGITISSMTIILSVSLRNEEAYRARTRLIMMDMENTHVPKHLRKKVDNFYRMYWHTKKGVAFAPLMDEVPPTLSNSIYSEIYFESQQMSLILRDLSTQFLCELAKKMTTVNYIPGDPIIKRNSAKSSIIYITYGDVEMLTAEDDMTPILRFSRGTVLSCCGGCPEAGCANAEVEIRAATYCTAHVLRAADLWNIVLRYGKNNGQAFIILSAFEEHMERVRRHYFTRKKSEFKYKSTILLFKRNLQDLKEARDDNGNLLLERVETFLEIASSYVMRNTPPGMGLMVEADEVCLKSSFPCILQQTSTLQLAWSSFVAVWIFIISLTHPYYLVYSSEPITLTFQFYDFMMYVVYFLDILMHLSTGSKIEEGVPITFKQSSSEQMKGIWFALDVAATLPIFEFIGDGKFAGLNKLLKLPKLLKLLKTLEYSAVHHHNTLRFCNYLYLVIIATYLVATCQQAFMCYFFKRCGLGTLLKTPYWHMAVGKQNSTMRLSYGLYFAIQLITFTGHTTHGWAMDVVQNRIYVMLLLELCVVLRIFIAAVYSATAIVSLTMRQEYQTCINSVRNLMKKDEVDPVLIQRYINYLSLSWYMDNAYSITHEKQSVMHDLPPHVYSELVATQRSRYMLRIPFMKYLSTNDLEYVASRARMFYTCPNEILVSTGELCNELYVIKQGFCEVYDPDTKEVVKILTSKDFFGVLECLFRLPTYYTVRTVTHAQILCISNEHLTAKVLTNVRAAVAFTRKQQEFHRLQLRRNPFLKYELVPPTGNRTMFPLPKKYEVDTLYLQPFMRLGPLSVLRYVCPRWTIRPDSPYLRRYELFRGLCALLVAFVAPCVYYMWMQFPWLQTLMNILDILAFLDMIQRTLVGYFDERGILITHPAYTTKHYLKGAFIVDLLGVLPLEYLNMGEDMNHLFKGMHMRGETTQYLMFNRLLQLYRFPNAMEALTPYITRPDIMLVIKFLPFYIALINCTTTGVFMKSTKLYARADKPGEYRVLPISLTKENETWNYIGQKHFRYKLTTTPFNLHLTCFYWVVNQLTFTGFRAFSPTSIDLLQIFYISIVIALMMMVYLTVEVISTRADVHQAFASFQEHMKDIRKFMVKEKVPEPMRKYLLFVELYNYYTYSWDKMGGTNYRAMLMLCDQNTLKTDTIVHVYGPTFSKCPVLIGADLSMLRLIGRAVQSVYFLEHTFLIEKDDCVPDLYFVDSGTVEVRDPEDGLNTIARLPKGSLFGNLEGRPTVRMVNAFEATSNTHLLKMRADKFHRFLREFPVTKRKFFNCRPKNTENYIVGGQKEIAGKMKLGKERAQSAVVIIAPRKGVMKYLNTHAKPIHIYLITIVVLTDLMDVYNAAFKDNSLHLIIILYCLDFLFLLKFFIKNVLEERKKQSMWKRITSFALRKNNYSTEFVLDVLSIIPIELFAFGASGQAFWIWFAMLRLNRVLRLFTIEQCMKRHRQKLKINLVVTTSLGMLIWYVIVMHNVACMWNLLGEYVDYKRPNSSWRHLDMSTPKCSSLYLCSLYFTINCAMHNGMDDIAPKWQEEVVFTCIVQLFFIVFHVIYIGHFCHIIQYKSYRFFNFYTSYLELIQFMKSNRVTGNLVKLARSYSLHLWREARGLQMPYFLDNAPQCLHTKIMNAVFARHLNENPVFGNCEKPFLRQLARHLRFYYYEEGMFIVKENEITDAMYIIHKGRVEEHDEELEAITGEYKAGLLFGMGLNRGIPYSHSYRAITKAEVLSLHFDDWEYLLKHFPNSKVTILDTPFEGEEEIIRDKENRRNILFPRGRTQFYRSQAVSASEPTPTPSKEKTPSRTLKTQDSAQPKDTTKKTSSKVQIFTPDAPPPKPTPTPKPKETKDEDLFAKYPSKRYSASDFSDLPLGKLTDTATAKSDGSKGIQKTESSNLSKVKRDVAGTKDGTKKASSKVQIFTPDEPPPKPAPKPEAKETKEEDLFAKFPSKRYSDSDFADLASGKPNDTATAKSDGSKDIKETESSKSKSKRDVAGTKDGTKKASSKVQIFTPDEPPPKPTPIPEPKETKQEDLFAKFPSKRYSASDFADLLPGKSNDTATAISDESKGIHKTESSNLSKTKRDVAAPKDGTKKASSKVQIFTPDEPPPKPTPATKPKEIKEEDLFAKYPSKRYSGSDFTDLPSDKPGDTATTKSDKPKGVKETESLNVSKTKQGLPIPKDATKETTSKVIVFTPDVTPPKPTPIPKSTKETKEEDLFAKFPSKRYSDSDFTNTPLDKPDGTAITESVGSKKEKKETESFVSKAKKQQPTEYEEQMKTIKEPSTLSEEPSKEAIRKPSTQRNEPIALKKLREASKEQTRDSSTEYKEQMKPVEVSTQIGKELSKAKKEPSVEHDEPIKASKRKPSKEKDESIALKELSKTSKGQRKSKRESTTEYNEPMKTIKESSEVIEESSKVGKEPSKAKRKSSMEKDEPIALKGLSKPVKESSEVKTEPTTEYKEQTKSIKESTQEGKKLSKVQKEPSIEHDEPIKASKRKPSKEKDEAIGLKELSKVSKEPREAKKESTTEYNELMKTIEESTPENKEPSNAKRAFKESTMLRTDPTKVKRKSPLGKHELTTLKEQSTESKDPAKANTMSFMEYKEPTTAFQESTQICKEPTKAMKELTTKYDESTTAFKETPILDKESFKTEEGPFMDHAKSTEPYKESTRTSEEQSKTFKDHEENSSQTRSLSENPSHTSLFTDNLTVVKHNPTSFDTISSPSFDEKGVPILLKPSKPSSQTAKDNIPKESVKDSKILSTASNSITGRSMTKDLIQDIPKEQDDEEIEDFMITWHDESDSESLAVVMPSKEQTSDTEASAIIPVTLREEKSKLVTAKWASSKTQLSDKEGALPPKDASQPIDMTADTHENMTAYMSKKGALSFKDQITTIQVPKLEEPRSLISQDEIDVQGKEDQADASMFAYADDIDMKKSDDKS